MTDPEPGLRLELDAGPWPGRGLERYHAGGLEISVGWHTEGRGDRDEETHHHQTLHAGALPPGEHAFPFAIPLPDSPASYAGHYVSIVWTATARLDLPGRHDPRVEAVFPLVPPGVEA